MVNQTKKQKQTKTRCQFYFADTVFVETSIMHKRYFLIYNFVVPRYIIYKISHKILFKFRVVCRASKVFHMLRHQNLESG